MIKKVKKMGRIRGEIIKEVSFLIIEGVKPTKVTLNRSSFAAIVILK